LGCAKEFSRSGGAKNGERAKRWKQGSGGGERKEHLPANSLILKNAQWILPTII